MTSLTDRNYEMQQKNQEIIPITKRFMIAKQFFRKKRNNLKDVI
jgi:hypothetical protein